MSKSALADKRPELTAVYPSHYYQEDEIHLGELLRNLLGQKILIGAVTLLGTLLAIVVALTLPKTYEVTAAVALPTQNQIEPININGIETMSVDDVFELYFRNLRSSRLARAYYDSQQFHLVGAEPEASFEREDINNAFAGFLDSFSVKVVEPDYLNLPKDAEIPQELVAISLLHNDGQAAADFVNGFLSFVEAKTIQQIKNQQSTEIRLQKSDIEKNINGLLDRAKRERETRIALLSESLAIAKSIELSQPATLQQAMVISESFIEQPQPSTRMSVEELTLLSEMLSGSEQDKKDRKQAPDSRQDANEFQPSYLYLKGTQMLQAELVQLSNRTDDSLYIRELPLLQNELSKLNSYNLDFQGLELKTTELEAFAPKSAVKPNKKLIVAVAFAGSLFLGLFLALIAIAIRRDEERVEHRPHLA